MLLAAGRASAHTVRMALEHARSGDVVALPDLEAAPPCARSHALLKSGQLEVMRLVLPAGAAMPEHRVAGDLTLQCLQGAARVVAEGSARPLRRGDLLYLRGGSEHSVQALEDCTLLLTLVLAPGPAA